jgi:hypothetical protein
MSSLLVRPALADLPNMMENKPAPKRSLFKKPAWAATGTETTGSDFFRQSASTYSGILAEKERRRAKHGAKRSSNDTGDRQDSKKRRTDSSESSDDESSGEILNVDDTGSKEQSACREGPITRSTPKKDKDAAQARSLNDISPVKVYTREAPVLIDLENGKDHGAPMPESRADLKKKSLVTSTQKLLSSDVESDDDDEYTKELKRKAREKARQRKLGIDATAAQSFDAPSRGRSQSPKVSQPTSASPGSEPSQPRLDLPTKTIAPPAEPDVVVQILIRSAIPDTTPLIVNRRSSQNLRLVKEAWCNRQGFDAAMTRKVFLMWRGTRLFNTTTCNSILKRLKEENRRTVVSLGSLDSDGDDGDDEDPSRGKIEVEAVTEEILAQRRKAKDADAAIIASPAAEAARDAVAAVEQQAQPLHMGVLLRAPGLEPLALKVRTNTLVSKMMAAFHKMRAVEEGMTCWITFDGERLEPGSEIAESEVQDGDVVDVQIR